MGNRNTSESEVKQGMKINKKKILLFDRLTPLGIVITLQNALAFLLGFLWVLWLVQGSRSRSSALKKEQGNAFCLCVSIQKFFPA